MAVPAIKTHYFDFKDGNKVKGPPNAFMMFKETLKNEYHQRKELCSDAGKIWNNMKESDKMPYYQLADGMRKRHKELYPSYKCTRRPKKQQDPIKMNESYYITEDRQLEFDKLLEDVKPCMFDTYGNMCVADPLPTDNDNKCHILTKILLDGLFEFPSQIKAENL